MGCMPGKMAQTAGRLSQSGQYIEEMEMRGKGERALNHRHHVFNMQCSQAAAGWNSRQGQGGGYHEQRTSATQVPQAGEPSRAPPQVTAKDSQSAPAISTWARQEANIAWLHWRYCAMILLPSLCEVLPQQQVVGK